MYKAKCYVRYKGKTYEPGECIPDDLSPEEVIWLNKAGAIEEVAPAVSKEAPKPAKTLVVQEPAREAAPEEVEEELPFIDVMDGVVQTEKPKKTRGRRKAK